MFEYVIFTFLVCLKYLMLRTTYNNIYHYSPSTDFEVHRNWKSITTSLSIEKWYYDETSVWTLDYPPLFAYMEYILGMISKHIDPRITELNNLDYKGGLCIYYQRATVLLGDIVLFYSLKR
jgi:alpha-1,3-glucosyltransferase